MKLLVNEQDALNTLEPAQREIRVVAGSLQRSEFAATSRHLFPPQNRPNAKSPRNIMRFSVSVLAAILRKHADLRNMLHELFAGLSRFPGNQLLEISRPFCDEGSNLGQVGIDRGVPTREGLQSRASRASKC
jgi:hypothetical protein